MRRDGIALGPTAPQGQLLQRALDLGLPAGLENSLLAKLDNALAKLDDGNPNNDGAAVNQLEAFINQVEAQRGKKISDGDADALIAAAGAIIALVSE